MTWQVHKRERFGRIEVVLEMQNGTADHRVRVHRYDAVGICETYDTHKRVGFPAASAAFDAYVQAFDLCATLGAEMLMEGV